MTVTKYPCWLWSFSTFRLQRSVIDKIVDTFSDHQKISLPSLIFHFVVLELKLYVSFNVYTNQSGSYWDTKFILELTGSRPNLTSVSGHDTTLVDHMRKIWMVSSLNCFHLIVAEIWPGQKFNFTRYYIPCPGKTCYYLLLLTA